jgi:hypothetical protein
MEVHRQNPAHDVFVDLDAEGQCDLLSDSFASPAAITPFHFDNRIDQLFRRSFGPWSTDSFWGEQQPVLLLHQHFVKMQQSRGL